RGEDRRHPEAAGEPAGGAEGRPRPAHGLARRAGYLTRTALDWPWLRRTLRQVRDGHFRGPLRRALPGHSAQGMNPLDEVAVGDVPFIPQRTVAGRERVWRAARVKPPGRFPLAVAVVSCRRFRERELSGWRRRC